MPEIDWTKSMQQTFEYYKVNPNSWNDEEKMDLFTNATITRDRSNATKEYANIEGNDIHGEFYVRIYLIATQNNYTYKVALGTFLIQTLDFKFNGKYNTHSVEAYSPLIELKEKNPPIGYYIPNNEYLMNSAIVCTRDNIRAPVVGSNYGSKVIDNSAGFAANFDDKWIDYLSELIKGAEYEYMLTPLGEVMFAPIQELDSMKPIWVYTDDNSSILHPDVELEEDLYGIPNVVEVLYTVNDEHKYVRVENNDRNSPASIQARGREIIHREETPDSQSMTEMQIYEYATNLLKSLSVIECTLTYSHGYCSVRVGDCVILDYRRSGIPRTKAVVQTQSIECKPGCPVTETATYIKKLWEG